ncbi:50S ribosomal protein L4 [Mycoplasma suis]|uniref:Large ribosomal subunit protein uL4 n=2 Tax=Mycoplasma suis TaxID=57372 RepID=F0QR36_MYCSL|nr:50S ribosomal protein L4 [Mycoplasma suis]ADX97956.1 50S ribosomal protein L4 [Mycoplasma suis str. Illinois]CBZ40452.1 50S ribosomal protein L4 [Mycoplasma suis KI3806]
MSVKEEIKIYTLDGEVESSIKFSDFIPDWKSDFYYSDAIFQTTVSEQQSKRLARPHTKTKGEVSGGGKKPYRQKHTGRARQGSRRNPQFVGGGVAFGPRKEVNHYKKVNKRIRALAIRSSWTLALNENRVFGISSKKLENFPANRTKIFYSFLGKLGFQGEKRVYLIVKSLSEDIVLGARNLPNLKVVKVNSITIFSLLNARRIILSNEGFEWLKTNYFSLWK